MDGRLQTATARSAAGRPPARSGSTSPVTGSSTGTGGDGTTRSGPARPPPSRPAGPGRQRDPRIVRLRLAAEPADLGGVAVVVVIVAFLVLRPAASVGSGAAMPVRPRHRRRAALRRSPSGSGRAPSPRTATRPAARRPSRRPAPAGQKELVTIETDLGNIAITRRERPVADRGGQLRRPRRLAATTTASCSIGVAALQDGTPFVIQGGDPTGTGGGGPGYTIQDEPVKTPYKRGTVAMARTSDAELGRLAVLHRPRRQGRGRPLEREHLPDHRLGDVRHGHRRQDLRRGRRRRDLPTNPVVGHAEASTVAARRSASGPTDASAAPGRRMP